MSIMVKVCPECGHKIADDRALFCNKCGGKINSIPIDSQKICSKCKAPIKDFQSKYCDKCGNTLSKKEEWDRGNQTDLSSQRENLRQIYDNEIVLPDDHKFKHFIDSAIYYEKDGDYSSAKELIDKALIYSPDDVYLIKFQRRYSKILSDLKTRNLEKIEPYAKQYWRKKTVKEKNQIYLQFNPEILSHFQEDDSVFDILNTNIRGSGLELIEQKRNSKDIDEIKEINNEIIEGKIYISFLDDITKMNKLLINKGIPSDKSILLSFLVTILHENIIEGVKNDYSSILAEIPTDASIPIENVIETIISYNFQNQDENDDYFYSSKLYALTSILQKSGYIYSTPEILEFIRKHVQKLQENNELQQFERELFSESVHANQESLDDFSIGNLNGFEFEQLLENFFTTCGYDVLLTKKTGDQGADLVISKDEDVIVIQAKCYSNQPVGNSAIQEVVAAKNYYKGNHALVIATTTFTRPAIELAEANDVELWDGKFLQEKLNEVFS